MTQSLSIARKTLDLSSLKNSAVEQDSSPTLSVRFWQRLSELFWAYTEESGKADTSPYEGLL